MYYLNIYGENDEIIKVYETQRARYGAFEEAINAVEAMDGKSEGEATLIAFRMLGAFAKKLFPGLTDDHIKLADMKDVANLAYAVSGKARPLAEASGADYSKN